jgi:hypothetical protein
MRRKMHLRQISQHDHVNIRTAQHSLRVDNLSSSDGSFSIKRAEVAVGQESLEDVAFAHCSLKVGGGVLEEESQDGNLEGKVRRNMKWVDGLRGERVRVEKKVAEGDLLDGF